MARGNSQSIAWSKSDEDSLINPTDRKMEESNRSSTVYCKKMTGRMKMFSVTALLCVLLACSTHYSYGQQIASSQAMPSALRITLEERVVKALARCIR